MIATRGENKWGGLSQKQDVVQNKITIMAT